MYIAICANLQLFQSLTIAVALSIYQVLNGIADQDTFYDITDYLEEQGMETIIQRLLSRNAADLDLVSQLNMYEAALRSEDGEGVGLVSDIRYDSRILTQGPLYSMAVQ